MCIPSYQIDNFLQVYGKDLAQSRVLERQNDPFVACRQPLTNNFNISVEGKHKALIDKVSADIIGNITRFGRQDEGGQENANQMQNELEEEFCLKRQEVSQFVFNVIDDNNKKITNSLSVEDPEFLIKRLEEAAEKV